MALRHTARLKHLTLGRAKYNPAPPVLPKTEVAGGLNFDGKDDWVQVSNVEWSYPQYTLEAFVTSANGR